MITLDNISYSYPKGKRALTMIRATLGSGIHLLLGENGAGKTTLLHVMSGLLTPQQGRCLLDGVAVDRREPSTQQSIFLMGDEMKFPARSVNDFAGRHARFFPTFSSEVLAEALAAFGMTGDEELDSMSFGTRKKAQMAYALALRTPVLLLDEPANGLDIDSRKVLRRLMSAVVTDEQTVVVSTHTVNDLGPLFDGVLVMRRSNLLLAATTGRLLSRLTFNVASVAPDDDALYVETDLGVFRSIEPNRTGEPLTDIDYSLLYSALMSVKAPALLQLLESEPK